MDVIKISNITKKYGKSVVLDNVSLTIENKEIVGLIGPSGAGKSTLVKAIMGMEKVNCGEVKVLDVNIPNLKVLNKIGYMAQSDALYEDLSGRDNLLFFAKLYKMDKAYIEKRIEYVSKIVKLEKDLSKKVSKYSGGMKRRLSLAISLIQNPDVFILDEPTVGIDPTLRLSIWNEINSLKSQGKSIIVTTHVMDEALRCDKLALINGGKIIEYGKPEDLLKQYEVKSIEEIFIKLGSEN
ncbi:MULTISPECIES: ABC transporter ATP-binding protein [unclassified Clostridium]|uniref:ABC transporter ATP-binding protein n=1 Tax=unclassified Clostridium TaxID=2614128 RepID=UPI0025BF53AA|nr:ABC transporter ATP-binding protein [Clostridium sp.]MDY4253242.1 ABC transporter ATP-binding protein [Clostridium sp.]